jgi:hypothetical protein
MGSVADRTFTILRWTITESTLKGEDLTKFMKHLDDE